MFICNEKASICFLFSYKSEYSLKIELKPKECIDAISQLLKNYVNIQINGSLMHEDIFRTVVNMIVNKIFVHYV
jgi:hypothetical protein